MQNQMNTDPVTLSKKILFKCGKIILSFQNLDPESYSVAVITTENVQDELQTGSEKYMNLFSEQGYTGLDV